MNFQPNKNGPNTKLSILYGKAIMNCTRHHVNFKFTPPRMDSVLVETWETFKISSTTIIRKYFKNTHTHTPSLLYISTNHQDFLACDKISKIDKAGNIGNISKAIIAPI